MTWNFCVAVLKKKQQQKYSSSRKTQFEFFTGPPQGDHDHQERCSLWLGPEILQGQGEGMKGGKMFDFMDLTHLSFFFFLFISLY